MVASHGRHGHGDAGGYPTCLRPFLGRPVDVVDFDEVARRLRAGERFFCKPTRAKAFTGRVFDSEEDIGVILHLEGARFWVSPVMEIRAEWRFFVANGKIVGSRRYRGDPLALFEPRFVRMAVHAYEDHGPAPGGYALDFALQQDGRTVLIEANPAYALGGYEVEPDQYLAVLMAWWDRWFAQARP